MESAKLYMVVILIQVILAGMYLLNKAAFNAGFNTFVFTFYRQAFASLILVPVTILVERKTSLPLSPRDICHVFMLALLGVTSALNLYAAGLRSTPSSLAASITNSLPVVTFLWALLFRQENLKLRSLPGRVKSVGVAICIGGITLLFLYRGPILMFLQHVHVFKNDQQPLSHHTSKEWIMGRLLLILFVMTWSLWLVLQGIYMKNGSQSKLLFSTLQSVFSTIQSFVVAVAFEQDFSRWKLGRDIGTLAVVYTGIMTSGIAFYLQIWCIEKKGPVFVAMFLPLMLLLTSILSAFLLGELIYTGSLVGGGMVVVGLYCVLWAKNKEDKDRDLPVLEATKAVERQQITSSEASLTVG